MESNFSIRQAIHPDHAKGMDTEAIRANFLIEQIFEQDKISYCYTMYDRYMAGGIMPITQKLSLGNPEQLKARFFLERREMGIINIGQKGAILIDGTEYILDNKEALYIGKGIESVEFLPGNETNQPLYYYNSAPAHHAYPTQKVDSSMAEVVEMGNMQQANERTIYKLLVNGVIQTCQLQMGLTELKPGSIWNTMPPHTHSRRMEIYFYFNLHEHATVCHFMGEPQETRHIWMRNLQAVISPPWSIHAGAGITNYSFIWGMAGENLDYSDMDMVQPNTLR